MQNPIIDLLGIVTAVLLLIFTSFTVTNKKSKVTSNKILSVFLFSNAICILNISLDEISKILGVNLLWFIDIGASFGFLFGPLLFLYSKSITLENFKISTAEIVHILPFIFILILVFIQINIPILYWLLTFHSFTSFYLLACIFVIKSYRRRIKERYSSIDKLNLDWMLYVVGAFWIMWMIDLFNFILSDFRLIDHSIRVYLTFFSLLINFVFAVIIFYKAIHSPEYFKPVEVNEKQKKYEQSRLTEIEKNDYLAKLEKFCLNSKPYLNPNLTISELAFELNISSKNLSQIINELQHKNFYDYINSFRINEAKKLLFEDKTSEKTILEILYTSGFNSKSVFNSVFKKNTGLTPSQFRQKFISIH